MRRASAWVVLAAGLTAVSPVTGQPAPAADLAAILTRVGQRVEQYYVRAQSLVARETVRIQPLEADLTPVGFGRRLAYELRVAWDPQHVPGTLPEATVLREILTVNGRAPRESDEPGCMDPKPVTPEPLGMLLASQRDDYTFSLAGTRTIDDRAAVMIDYKPLAAGEAEIQWTEKCVSISLPGRSRGRIWIDAATDEVLRLDDHLVGLFEFRVPEKQMRRGVTNPYMVIERADTSIRYKSVEFEDPDETLVLPVSVETVTIIRGSGEPRVRITQRFSDYRRFLTGGRLVNR